MINYATTCTVCIQPFYLFYGLDMLACLRVTGERWLRDYPEASTKMMDLLTGVIIDYMAAQVPMCQSQAGNDCRDCNAASVVLVALLVGVQTLFWLRLCLLCRVEALPSNEACLVCEDPMKLMASVIRHDLLHVCSRELGPCAPGGGRGRCFAGI